MKNGETGKRQGDRGLNARMKVRLTKEKEGDEREGRKRKRTYDKNGERG